MDMEKFTVKCAGGSVFFRRLSEVHRNALLNMARPIRGIAGYHVVETV
jgi:hypothetical protein